MLKSDYFIYWLQGFFEISGAKFLNEEQTSIIKEHLELCFKKVAVPSSIPHDFKPPLHGSSTVTSVVGGGISYNPSDPNSIVTIC